jgi:hypothetical protein
MESPIRHPTASELEANLPHIRHSPKDNGVLYLIVRRTGIGQREVLQEGRLDLSEGLVGDSWSIQRSPRRASPLPHLDTQLTITNSRAIALMAQAKERWPLAGDQLYLDLDLSGENLPPGTRLSLGSAIIEVTAQPHTGCKKFLSRFGPEAMNFVNFPRRPATQLARHQCQGNRGRRDSHQRRGAKDLNSKHAARLALAPGKTR